MTGISDRDFKKEESCTKKNLTITKWRLKLVGNKLWGPVYSEEDFL
jgi:hypothetical protein